MRGRKGNARALPDSAHKVLLGVRKWHQKQDVELVAGRLVQLSLKRLCRKHLIDYGAGSLVPTRKEPMTRSMIVALLSPEREGLTVGRGLTLSWATPMGRALRGIIAVLASTGFRKSEVTLDAGQTFDRTCASRASLTWCQRGHLYAAPRPELLRDPQPGDYGLLAPPLSKSDQCGATWGASPIYLHYRAGESLCAFSALADTELHDPVVGPRESVPLFSPDGGQPFRGSVLDSILRAMLVSTVGAARAKLYSWHSFRIWLACSLLASGASRPQIQALCRWQTEESLDIYARLNGDTYARLLGRAIHADISSVRTTSLEQLVLDNEDLLRQLLIAQESQQVSQCIPGQRRIAHGRLAGPPPREAVTASAVTASIGRRSARSSARFLVGFAGQRAAGPYGRLS